MMDDTYRQQLLRRIEELSVEHRDLDHAIGRLADTGLHDELHLKRLKKRRLLLKDQLQLLRRQIEPDVPA